MEGLEVDIIEKIKKAKNKDEDIIRVVEEIKKAEVKVLQGDEQQIKEELVLKEEKVYVPKNEELRAEIIWLHYDMPVIGHRGRQKTTELVTRNYWQLGVTRDMGRYVEGCNLWQRMKNRMEEIAGN